MTNKTTIDPEEMRLRDAVIEAALKIVEEQERDDGCPDEMKLVEAANALRDYRAKASDPKPELLPCPFCGSKAHLTADDDGAWRIKCHGCWCEMDYASAQKAIERWNSRAKSASMDGHSRDASAPPSRCQPPEQLISHRYHWLARKAGMLPALWNSNDMVWELLDGLDYSPERLGEIGYLYHSPQAVGAPPVVDVDYNEVRATAFKLWETAGAISDARIASAMVDYARAVLLSP